MNIQVRRLKDGKIFTLDSYTDEILSIVNNCYHIAVTVKWRDSENYQPLTQALICTNQDYGLDDYELKHDEEFGEIL